MIVEFILSAINFFLYGYFEVTVKIFSGKNKVWTEHSSWLLNLSDYCCINSACQNFNFIRNTYRESISVYLLWKGGYDTNIYQITCTLRGRGLSWDILCFIPPPLPPTRWGWRVLKKEFFISSSIKLKIIGPFRHFFLKVLTNNPLPAEQKGISWVITPHKKQKIIGTR